MVKKVLGALFLLGALLIVIGSVVNESLPLDQGLSGAEALGAWVGMLLPVVAYLLSGIFLLSFDRVYTMNYIQGFKIRAKQNAKTITFCVAYAVLMLMAALGVGAAGPDNIVVAFVLAILPYFIPFAVFVFMMVLYCIPYSASKKHFLKNDAMLKEYLSADEAFFVYSDDKSVLASKKALFFPKLFCVVPYHQIASTKLVKQLWEQDVYFHLVNGKKFFVISNHYERIQQAINAGKRAQQQ